MSEEYVIMLSEKQINAALTEDQKCKCMMG